MNKVHPFGWAVIALVAIVVLGLMYGMLFSTPPKVDAEKFMSYAGSLIGIVVALFSPKPTN